MRRQENVRKRAQRMVSRQGLLFIGINDSPQEMLASQCFQQRLFINDPATSHVHHDRLPGKPCNLPLADHPRGLVSERSVKRQNTRLVEKGLQRFCFANAERFEARLSDVRIVCDYVHSEYASTGPNFSPDPSKPDDSERPPLELRAQ